MQRVIETNVARPQHVRIAPSQGTISWVLQRLTAYGLIVFLGVHMWFNHYANIRTGNILTFEIVNRRFYVFPVLYAINDVGLLTFALFHGLNGVRNVIYDWTTNTTLRRVATIILLAIGAVALWDGTLTLLAIMSLPPAAAR